MFYVSNIQGALFPFDPRITAISSTAQAATAVTEVNAVYQTSTTPIAVEAVAPSEIPTVQDAAVYEGHTLASSAEILGMGNAVNTARAGSVMAYRLNTSEHLNEPAPAELTGRVGKIQDVKEIDDDAGKSHERVNPIKPPSYRYAREPQARKPVVIAEDIMSSPVHTLEQTLPLEEALNFFKQHRFRHVPIISSDKKLVGIVSDRDYLGPLPIPSHKVRQIKECMITNILTARPQTEIRAIAEIMIARRIGCLPIVDQDAALVGILTRSDILRAIVNHAPLELWT